MLVTDPLAALPDVLHWPTETLDRLIAELADPALHPTPAHRLARAWALGARFDRDHDPATLAAALADYAASTYRGPRRGTVGRFLALRHLRAAMHGRPADLGAVRAMVAEAGDDPVLPGSAALLLALTDVVAAFNDDPAYDRAEALRRLDELAETFPPETELSALVPTMRMALTVKRGADRGALADAAAAAEHARMLLDSDDPDPERRAAAGVMLAGAEGLAAAQHGDMDTVTAKLMAVTDMAGSMPAGPQRAAIRRLIAGGSGDEEGVQADEPGLAAGERAWRLLLTAMSILRPALDRQDVAEVGRGVRVLREAATVAPADSPHRVTILSMLGQMLTVQSGLGAGRPALDEGIRRLTEAQREAGGPAHPVWPTILMPLGMAHRAAGRAALGRETGQRALRGHAWSVLLQAGSEDAATAARDAAVNAKLVARWCLADGDPAGAVAALDAGRCLMLYATTVTMDIPSRLRGLGRTDLLARWLRDSSDADVRGEVLAALTGGELTEAAVPDVLDPPPLDEVARALATLRADALVYLLPADDEGPGGALLVAADGRRPVHLSLPGLTTAGPVAHHVDRLGSRAAATPSRGPLRPSLDASHSPFPDISPRDAGASDEPVAEDWRSGLDALCDWAWRVAIGPLLSTLDGWRIGRAPRLVLVPMGDLAAVPWHAARDRDGTRAVELATFSYAASARLLCQTAERPPVPDTAALIVADPTGDLPAARAEAEAVRAAFYPTAGLLHEASPDAVREWLLSGGGSVLHLACHGSVLRGIDGSHLRLAGGRLTARDILAAKRVASVGLVALAACTTGVPSGDYDEAFSLATAFLATGARSVFSSLWPVPDDTTSLLMFMAHHYVRSAGKHPVDALNHAQRWMLDPGRSVPPAMPPQLARQARAMTTPDVAAWAGFTHHGW